MKKKFLMTMLLTTLAISGCGKSNETANSNPIDSGIVDTSDNTSDANTSESKDDGTNDYGKVTIVNQNVRVGYTRQIVPIFSNEAMSDEVLTYSVGDETVCTIDENGLITGHDSGNAKVTVTSEHFKTFTFWVMCEADSKFSGTVTARFNSYLNKDYPETGRTLFAGDSFFDTQFWSNFYTSYYKNYNCYTMGISATQALDWYYYAQKLLVPFEPENIVFHIGTNDINDAHCDANGAFKRIKNLMDYLHSELPETKIYLFGIEPSTTFASNFVTDMACNELTKAYCQENSDYMVYLDSPSAFLNEAGTGANSSMLRDGLHPNLDQYTIYDNLLKENGLNLTEIEHKEEKVTSWKPLNAADNSFVTVSDDEKSVTVNAIKSGANCTSNRVFYSADHVNAYKGNLMITGKVKYDNYTGNHFVEFYFGKNTDDWSNDNTFQYLLWGERAIVFQNNAGVETGVQSVAGSTEYEFTAALYNKVAYIKFGGKWYSRALSSDSAFSISAENLITYLTELNVTTDSGTIKSAIPEKADYTF